MSKSCFTCCFFLSFLLLVGLGCSTTRPILRDCQKSYEAGAFDKAILDCGFALKTNPDAAYAYLARGVAFLKKSQFEKAISDFDQVIRIQPDHSHAYGFRGMAHAYIEAFDDAISDLNVAINLKPAWKGTDLYYFRALSWASKREYKKAIQDFNEVILIHPRHANAHHYRGLAWERLGAYDKAVADMKQALQIEPNNDSFQSALVSAQSMASKVKPEISPMPSVAQAPRQVEPPSSTLSLSLSTSQPNAEGVVTLTITTNSDTASLKINGDEAGGRADGRYALKRFAQVGENKFEVVATDRFGNTQRQTVSVKREFVQAAPSIPALNPLAVRAVKQRDAVAVVIGIEKYRSVPAADFANRDASIFVDYATRALGIPRENIRLLLDDKAGAAEILLTFKNWLPTRIKRGSTDVYVFYSGHGLPSEDGESLFFLPHEANRDLLERTAISQNELVAAIQKSSPKSVTMFIDSCYSGQSRTGETLLTSARPISIVAKETSSFPSNFTVISASAPDQISSSSPELRHGIFSYYLMRGMEGEADANGDKQITVAEMQAYLSEQVPRRAMRMNRTQQPQVVGDQSRVLVVR